MYRDNVTWAVALLTASLTASLLQVILMCSSEETGQAELQLLAQVQKALKDSAQPHVMVYAVQPHAGEASPTRRSLLAVGRKSRRDFVCDAPCQAQVSTCHACASLHTAEPPSSSSLACTSGMQGLCLW